MSGSPLPRVAGSEPRRGPWMATYPTRTPFYPADPRAEDIHIEDIAQALSNICRYGGHVPTHYCPTEEQLILTADLCWVPAGDLREGSELFAFDEEPAPTTSLGAGDSFGRADRRRWRHATIRAYEKRIAPVYLLELSNGKILRSTSEHPWLVSVKGAGNAKWLPVAEIKRRCEQGRKTWLREYMPVWRQETSYDAGWLAGLYDGEGCLRLSGRGLGLSVAQKPGVVLDRIVELHKYYGFNFRMPSSEPKTQIVTPCGGWRETARLLGSFRPRRMVGRVVQAISSGEFDKRFDSINKPIEVLSVRRDGKGTIVGMETTTSTYLCEGFAAHNSVAHHSVLVSRLCEREAGRPEARWGLLHDAAEAYLGDLIWPLKQVPELAAPFARLEGRILRLVAERFGLDWPVPEVVKWADLSVRAAEARDLLGDPEWARKDGYPPAASTEVKPWISGLARHKFQLRWKELWEDS